MGRSVFDQSDRTSDRSSAIPTHLVSALNPPAVQNYLTSLDNEPHSFQFRNILERIALYSYKVGQLSNFETTDPIIPADQLSRVQRSGTNRLRRSNSGF